MGRFLVPYSGEEMTQEVVFFIYDSNIFLKYILWTILNITPSPKI